MTSKNVVIAGVGGQGNILASKIIAEAAQLQGMKALLGEVYGSGQRGGSVESHIRIGEGVLSPMSPLKGANVICGLEPMEALRAAVRYVRPDGIVVTNVRTYQPIAVNFGRVAYPPVEKILGVLRSLCRSVEAFDATALAVAVGGAVFTNMVLLGALSTLETIGLSLKAYEEAVSRNVPKARDLNLRAFYLGREECSRKAPSNPRKLGQGRDNNSFGRV